MVSTRKRKRAQDEAEEKLVTHYNSPFLHLELWENIYKYLPWNDLWKLHFVASFFYHHVSDFVKRNNVIGMRFFMIRFANEFFQRPIAPKWPHILEFATPQTEESLAKVANWLHDFTIKQITFKNQRPPANSPFYKDKAIVAYLKNPEHYPREFGEVFKGARVVNLAFAQDRSTPGDGHRFLGMATEAQTCVVHHICTGGYLVWRDVKHVNLHFLDCNNSFRIYVQYEQLDVSEPLSIHILSSISWRPNIYIVTDAKTPFHFKFSRRNSRCQLPHIRFMRPDNIPFDDPLKPSILSWKTPVFRNEENESCDVSYPVPGPDRGWIWGRGNNYMKLDVPVEIYDDQHDDLWLADKYLKRDMYLSVSKNGY